MVQIVITSWWPMTKAEEVQKKFLEISQEKGQSPAIKSSTMYISGCKAGWKNKSYNEVEQGNIEEALNFLADFMQGFNVIEGYSYKFGFAVTPEEIAAAQQG
jgi:hypothetical protein